WLGRTVGVHLLSACQRREAGRARVLDTELSYRFGVRTFSASESRAVLGVPDAYELPSIPGSGYLKVDTSNLIRFKGAYVSGGLPKQRRPSIAVEPVPVGKQPVRFTLAPAALEQPPPSPPANAAEDSADASTGETVLDVLVRRLAGRGPSAYQIWLPPLTEPPTIDQIMPGLRQTEDRGYALEGYPGNSKLAAAVAIVDKPFEQ